MPQTGQLRHKITIEQLSATQDPNTGEMIEAWSTFATTLAAIAPLSGRELLTAQQVASNVSARVIIRYQDGVNPSMRVNRQGAIYSIEAVIPDSESGTRSW